MAREHSTTEIPEDRVLSGDERSLVRWMLEHGESHALPFLPQLEEARVAARCPCGCASIDFAIGTKRAPNSGGMDILPIMSGKTPKDTNSARSFSRAAAYWLASIFTLLTVP
jgi:hypothetical protein